MRPAGYTANTGNPTYQALLGVGFVYINRYESNWGYALQNRSLIRAVQQASTPIFAKPWGDDPALTGTYSRLLTNVLNGPQNTGDCGGLMLSFDLAHSIIDYVFDNGRYHSMLNAGRDLQVFNPVSNALYFHSFNTRKPVSSWPQHPYWIRDINFNGKTLHFFALPIWNGYGQTVTPLR
jgi:hypothetical protein